MQGIPALKAPSGAFCVCGEHRSASAQRAAWAR